MKTQEQKEPGVLWPKMFRVRQRFDIPPPIDVTKKLVGSLAEDQFTPAPGARIGVAIGSRGIAGLKDIVTAVLEWLKRARAHPFIIPAMGSHGGATPEGQREILAEFGVTEESAQVPIRSAMETKAIGTTPEGLEVHCSKEALNADGIVVVNRIKPHTDFDSDSQGSGLLKMLVVGLGKHTGAARFHIAVTRSGYEATIRSAARIVLGKLPVLFGIGIIENQIHETADVAVIPAEQLVSGESRLFAEAKRLMPRLPFDNIDLLIVDRIGKNISGTGMDPNIIGRPIHGYSSALDQVSKHKPNVRRIFVRDLTPETHGNGIGIGMADFTTARVTRAFNPEITFMNALTSLSLNAAKLPIYFATDREAIQHALTSLAGLHPYHAKVVRIQDTLSLATFEVSESCREVIDSQTPLEALGESGVMKFGPDDNLLPLEF